MKPYRLILIVSVLTPAVSFAAPANDAAFWTGHPTAPAFAKISSGRIDNARAAIAKMLAVKGNRTVDNTLETYDEALRALDEAGSQAGLMQNVHPDSNMRVVAEKAVQDVSAYGTELSLDRRVYDALKAIDVSKADPITRFYVERELRDFRLAGVDKDQATRDKIKALRDELVKIGQDFDRNIREDVRTIQVDPAQLEGLPADYIENHKPGPDGKVTLDINYPDYFPVMSYAKNDDVRRRLYVEFNNRAHPKNLEVLDRLVAKRHELAQLLGYPNWAEYVTANKMVETAGNVRTFIDKIVTASSSRADREYKQLLERKRRDVPDAKTVTFWENTYYSELLRKSDYDFDSQSVRPYFAYARVKQGILDLTSRLFGVSFKQVEDAPVWHPKVDCYEMFEDGKLVGRFYLDMHPRANKFNHAAQFDARTGVAGVQIPEAILVCNFPGGDEGDPGLMEHEDVETFLHEFGHLLHTLFAGRQAWCGIGGIRTEHDFVEAPSQMLEEWAWDPATLATFARHHETNQPIPAELVLKARRAKDYGEGLRVRRQMVYADLSLSIYNRPASEVNTDALMKDLVQKYQPFPYVDDTHFQTSFGHLDGYSAVYYTYMWSLVIAKDMFGQFNRSNMLDTAIATRYRKAVLTPGGSKPAAKLVEDFLGRPFNFAAYEKWLNEQDAKGGTQAGKASSAN